LAPFARHRALVPGVGPGSEELVAAIKLCSAFFHSPTRFAKKDFIGIMISNKAGFQENGFFVPSSRVCYFSFPTWWFFHGAKLSYYFIYF
jgi:hypothetical protein